MNTTNVISSQRILYLDAIKGFAIFLMVFAHSIAWSFQDYKVVLELNANQDTQSLQAGFLWHFIYSFHMALFFLVSGFLTYKSVGGGV